MCFEPVKSQNLSIFKMMNGFERLQAMVRTRQLHTSYIEMRSRILEFQSFCRGFLARREYKIKTGAIMTIQAGFRMVLAKKKVQRLRQEVFSNFIALKFIYLYILLFNNALFFS